ncbi:MAG: RCC1-like domain-containing protein, partial [Flammeovirgaceae bacterium]
MDFFNQARLWGWGENKLGQLGLGKIQVVDVPTYIEILDLPGGQMGCSKA